MIARTGIAVAACLLGTAWSQNTNRATGIGVITGTVRAADGSAARFVPTYYSKGPSPVDARGDHLELSAGSTTRMNFVLLQAGAVSGRVSNAFGLPVVRAEVSAVAPTATQISES